MIQVGFIGCGNMGSAIIRGLQKSSTRTQIFAYDTDKEKLEAIEGIVLCSSECEVVKRARYVFLAVKPQVFASMLTNIAPYVTEDTVLVSIAAGVTAESIRSLTRADAKVVLVMPNTPLLLGEGASALAQCSPTSDEEFQAVRDIFDSCGTTAVLPEELMKEVIAINGSSPAFIYLYAKGFVDYAKSVGIAESVALPLFAQSLIGSAHMLTDSDYSLEELIRMVSSPGGTTLAGLDKLYEGQLTQTVEQACKACTKRAYELSNG